MAARLKTVIVVLVFCYVQSIKSANVSTEKSTNKNLNSDGFGYEVLLAKMDYIEYKFMELEFEVKEQNEQIMQNQDRLEKTHEGMSWMITTMEQEVSHNFTAVLNQSWQILQQQKICSNHDSLRKSIFNLKPIKGPSDNVRFLFDLQQISARGPFESCKSEPSKISGKYILESISSEEQFTGYCEQTRFGGGWLVIQRRYDGSVNFNRNWTEYKQGFGQSDKEFWIGLELLHKLTNGKNYQLLIELEDFTGNHKYAKYAAFNIGNESEKYSLKTLGSYSGTAGDSLVYHKGMKFSNADSDNDASSSNCAVTTAGAWWYNSCQNSNLNGQYMTGTSEKSISWYHFSTSYAGMQYSRMLIREL